MSCIQMNIEILLMWACLVEGFNTLVTTGVLNLPDKRVDPDCWLRSGFESPRRQLGFKPLSGSYQLRTLHCRATLICASFGGLKIYYHFPFSIYYSNLTMFFHFFRSLSWFSSVTTLDKIDQGKTNNNEHHVRKMCCLFPNHHFWKLQ